MKAVRAMPDGFEIEFTKPADKKWASDLASYTVESFIYKYHPVYGSPTVNNKKLAVKGVKVSEDGYKARIVVDGLRTYYIHNITLDGIREQGTFVFTGASHGVLYPECDTGRNEIIAERNQHEELRHSTEKGKGTKATGTKSTSGRRYHADDPRQRKAVQKVQRQHQRLLL
jgi:hypothetical protein